MKFVSILVAAAFMATSTEAFAPTSSQVRTTQNNVNNAIIRSPTSLSDMLTQAELPQKLYTEKEAPQVLGGLKIGNRKLTVITGASSGLGLNCAATLAKSGRHFVVMAVRDVEKGKRVAQEFGMPEN
jgi:protochlorophyllide reductase